MSKLETVRIRRAFKYRLYPNVAQTRALEEMLETLRRLYNACLEQRKTAFETDKTRITLNDQSKQFTQQRKTNEWYAKLTFNVAHAAITKLDLAFKAFFRRCKNGETPGYPRFKGREFYNSIQYERHGSGNKLHADRKRLYLQHVGEVKIRLHRPIEGEPKTVAVKREGSKWYAVFSCDLGDVPVQPSRKPAIALIPGLLDIVTTSEGDVYPGPLFLHQSLAELRYKSRVVSRKKRGSSNRIKAKVALRRLHDHIANQRRDHRHKLVAFLVENYGRIVVPEVNVQASLQDRYRARAFSDRSWGSVLLALESKAQEYGVAIVKVAATGLTETCSQCGSPATSSPRALYHECRTCRLVLPMNQNAARNLLSRGLSSPERAAGA